MNEPSDKPLLQLLYRRPGFLLRRAHQLSVGIFEDECKAIRITPAQFGALTILGEAGGASQSLVARALGFDRVTTLHIMRGLEGRGLVRRDASPDHARRLRLTLTADGKTALEEANSSAERSLRKLMDPLDSIEKDQLVSLLVKLCAGLESTSRVPLSPPPDARDEASSRAASRS